MSCSASVRIVLGLTDFGWCPMVWPGDCGRVAVRVKVRDVVLSPGWTSPW